jgi:hypothetical protein
VLRTVFAISIVVALVSGCVMPQHRGVATVSNGYLFASGFALAAIASGDESNPNSFRDLDRAASELAAAMMLLGLAGEMLTVTLHHDDPDDLRPVAVTHDAPLRGRSALSTLRVSVP